MENPVYIIFCKENKVIKKRSYCLIVILATVFVVLHISYPYYSSIKNYKGEHRYINVPNRTSFYIDDLAKMYPGLLDGVHVTHDKILFKSNVPLGKFQGEWYIHEAEDVSYWISLGIDAPEKFPLKPIGVYCASDNGLKGIPYRILSSDFIDIFVMKYDNIDIGDASLWYIKNMAATSLRDSINWLIANKNHNNSRNTSYSAEYEINNLKSILTNHIKKATNIGGERTRSIFNSESLAQDIFSGERTLSTILGTVEDYDDLNILLQMSNELGLAAKKISEYSSNWMMNTETSGSYIPPAICKMCSTSKCDNIAIDACTFFEFCYRQGYCKRKDIERYKPIVSNWRYYFRQTWPKRNRRDTVTQYLRKGRLLFKWPHKQWGMGRPDSKGLVTAFTFSIHSKGKNIYGISKGGLTTSWDVKVPPQFKLEKMPLSKHQHEELLLMQKSEKDLQIPNIRIDTLHRRLYTPWRKKWPYTLANDQMKDILVRRQYLTDLIYGLLPKFKTSNIVQCSNGLAYIDIASTVRSFKHLLRTCPNNDAFIAYILGHLSKIEESLDEIEMKYPPEKNLLLIKWLDRH